MGNTNVMNLIEIKEESIDFKPPYFLLLRKTSAALDSLERMDNCLSVPEIWQAIKLLKEGIEGSEEVIDEIAEGKEK